MFANIVIRHGDSTSNAQEARLVRQATKSEKTDRWTEHSASAAHSSPATPLRDGHGDDDKANYPE